MIYVRFTRANGAGGEVKLPDHRLQEVWDRAAKEWGDGSVLEIPDKLPEPSEESVRRWAGLPFKKEKK